MPKVEVNFELSDVLEGYRHLDEDGNGRGPVTVLDAIIAEAGRQLVERIVKDTSGYGGMVNRAREVRDEILTERLAPLIEDALTRSVQPTDGYGQPKGEPTTLAEIITKQAETWLRAPRAENRSGYGPQKTNVQWLVEEATTRTFQQELAPVVAQAKAEVRAAVQEKGAAVLAETITRMAREGT